MTDSEYRRIRKIALKAAEREDLADQYTCHLLARFDLGDQYNWSITSVVISRAAQRYADFFDLSPHAYWRWTMEDEVYNAPNSYAKYHNVRQHRRVLALLFFREAARDVLGDT